MSNSLEQSRELLIERLSVAKKEKRIRAQRMRLKEERKRRKAQERRNRKK